MECLASALLQADPGEPLASRNQRIVQAGITRKKSDKPVLRQPAPLFAIADADIVDPKRPRALCTLRNSAPVKKPAHGGPNH
jgi:hypothetical protein